MVRQFSNKKLHHRNQVHKIKAAVLLLQQLQQVIMSRQSFYSVQTLNADHSIHIQSHCLFDKLARSSHPVTTSVQGYRSSNPQ